jgi:hypothetical protein
MYLMRTPTPTNVLNTTLKSGTNTSTEPKGKQAKFNLQGMYAKSMRRLDAKHMKMVMIVRPPKNRGGQTEIQERNE